MFTKAAVTLRPAFSTALPAGAEESWEFIFEESSEGRGSLTSRSRGSERGKTKDEAQSQVGAWRRAGKEIIPENKCSRSTYREISCFRYLFLRMQAQGQDSYRGGSYTEVIQAEQ